MVLATSQLFSTVRRYLYAQDIDFPRNRYVIHDTAKTFAAAVYYTHKTHILLWINKKNTCQINFNIKLK